MFSDRFSRFDTIPAVTDSHPASHVAVAITLNAKASSLKTKHIIGMLLTELPVFLECFVVVFYLTNNGDVSSHKFTTFKKHKEITWNS